MLSQTLISLPSDGQRNLTRHVTGDGTFGIVGTTNHIVSNLSRYIDLMHIVFHGQIRLRLRQSVTL